MRKIRRGKERDYTHLNEPFSPVIVIVKLVSKVFKGQEDVFARHGINGYCICHDRCVLQGQSQPTWRPSEMSTGGGRVEGSEWMLLG